MENIGELLFGNIAPDVYVQTARLVNVCVALVKALAASLKALEAICAACKNWAYTFDW